MMPDIFSIFDPHMSSYFIPIKLIFLLIIPLGLSTLFTNMFPINAWVKSLTFSSVEVMFSQFKRTSAYSLKGMSHYASLLFTVIILINLTGLLPYCFSLSSHLLMTLSLGLPMWLGLIISSFMKAPKASTAHFLPDGAPDWLNPFLVLIETVSVMVRPLTLSFRLAANMTAGHVVMSLIGIYLASGILSSLSTTLILMSVESFYIMFEVAICLIQAYIFLLLVSLYSDDHSI